MRKIFFAATLLLSLMYGCSVSYQFNGASINYDLVKTINIREFMNQAPLVYPPLTQVFNEKLKDTFNRNTKLSFTEINPDLEIEGEIVRYDLAPMAVKENALASETRLTMTVRMRFRNNKEPEKDKEESYSAYQDFDSSNMLTDVQDQLIEALTDEITDQIFNATMSDW